MIFDIFSSNYVLVPLEVFGNDPYKTLVSTMMSARTKDETTLVAANRLFEKAKNINELSKLESRKIEKLIYPVGFYKTKARHLKTMSQIVVKEFSSKVPESREELISLPGVGRKTANLVLNRAFGKPAIAVDTHVHRICNLLGWVNTNSPEKTEAELVKIIPIEYWGEMNRLFVSIGRQYTTNSRLREFLIKNKLINTDE